MNKPLRPCKHPSCSMLTDNTYCDKHQKEVNARRDSIRLSSHERGYTSKWRKASKAFLDKHPWCTECMKHYIYEAATETDHIIPHKGNMKLFWDKSNWQGLCHSCHSRKTAKEDGGFGR
jgi:5-methylcytosine-specific restriction protein A